MSRCVLVVPESGLGTPNSMEFYGNPCVSVTVKIAFHVCSCPKQQFLTHHFVCVHVFRGFCTDTCENNHHAIPLSDVLDARLRYQKYDVWKRVNTQH